MRLSRDAAGTRSCRARADASAARASRGSAIAAGFMARHRRRLQTAFNRDLTDALKGLKPTGRRFWWLGGISFLYGIVHAAGPGHGKVVISSYLVANEQRVRRGVAIAFLAAFVQALVAVGIVGLMAALLNMTSMAIDRHGEGLRGGKLCAGRGARALSACPQGRAGVGAAARRRSACASSHHHHGHRAPSRTGQWRSDGQRRTPAHRQHHAAPVANPGRKRGAGLAGAAAAVLSVGIRPCSGALVVLVFALAQGIFWAGVASTFLMALGTAITVAALAALAVGAKDFARRLTRGDDRRAGQVMLGAGARSRRSSSPRSARCSSWDRSRPSARPGARSAGRAASPRRLGARPPSGRAARRARRPACARRIVFQRGEPGAPIGFRVGGVVRRHARDLGAERLRPFAPGEDAALVQRDGEREGARRPGRGEDRPVVVARNRGDGRERRRRQARSR